MCFFKTPSMTAAAQVPTLTAKEILPETTVETPSAPVFGGTEAAEKSTAETGGATGISSLKIPKMEIPKVPGLDITGANRGLNAAR